MSQPNTDSQPAQHADSKGWFAQNWVALTTIWIKECTRFLRIWVQTLVPPAITMSLYFIIFGSLIGDRIGQMGGFTYMEFIVPGLIMMSVITNSYSNVSSSFFSAKFQRNVEELLVAPVPTTVIILGYVGGGVARAILIGIIVTLVSLFFVDVQIHNLAVIVVTLILTSTLFATAGLINAVFAKTFDDISMVPTFVLTPLTYLGGVFYSLTLLPEFWQWVSKANPIVYMVNGFRYGFLGVSDVGIVVSLTLLVGFNALLFSVAYYLLKTGKGIRS
ncbi:ABC transporter permease [Alteromonas sp. ASW11-19]|uniref:Transport permease protein n=1 Tax=Alteromonas salexigens TaxID=2982530 RepID=A0ABT2VMS9_9ALTE|nr:ABC transporter permease [Alteromonas salexigens]MCU7554554.1 ABC transporter permease [Alteromonas salexigens]